MFPSNVDQWVLIFIKYRVMDLLNNILILNSLCINSLSVNTLSMGFFKLTLPVFVLQTKGDLLLPK